MPASSHPMQGGRARPGPSPGDAQLAAFSPAEEALITVLLKKGC